MKKILFLSVVIALSLQAEQFSNMEQGSISGLGIGMASKINLKNKDIKTMDKHSRIKACKDALENNHILKSFNDRYSKALELAAMDCAEQLQKIKW